MGTRDCGSTDALKVNINAFDASGIFRDVYKHIMSTADRGSTLDLMRAWVAGILKFSPG